MKIELLNYFDVWGNEEDGYEVNDQTRHEHDDFPDVIADQSVLDFLINKDYIVDATLDDLEICDQGDYIQILDKLTGKPLYGISLLED
jgi:hypothetical protein